MIKVGIVGGAGYTAGELIRLLINHSKVELDFVYSTSNAGNYIYNVHQDLLGALDLKFSGEVNSNVDVLFLCLGHGNSRKFLEQNQFSKTTKIIDLSNDFRLEKDEVFQGKEFVYGMPELQKDSIESANYIANPGCFATAIQLAVLPLAKAGLLNDSIHINATTGSTGAGVSPSETTHFSWRDNNFSVYKAFTHQHLGEITESLVQLQPNFAEELFFIPNRGNFSRGIFASIYLKFNDDIEKAFGLYEDFYKDAVFTKISKNPIHLKQVVNTNNCF
ncbi:MAG: N-acetyl-gamma-glutamyl-phosphate reductase, partial [Lutibacter sp.]|nr:N-acetyl-gamma-glutamyl-phosphate reductase [Lutibacter sp.]